MASPSLEEIQITGPSFPAVHEILIPEAKKFLAQLHKKFNGERLSLLKKRQEKQALLNEGKALDFLAETAKIREDLSWRVPPPPKDLEKRFVEITGPTERKMMINALNSGADVFMADFEDSLSPTWSNVIEGQVNLKDAINKTISYKSPEGKEYKLNERTAVLVVRPRGWHLPEKHVLIDGEQISGSLFDFGLYFFHNARQLIQKNTAPYFYLPKMESHEEARLWNKIFEFAQDSFNIPRGTIRATVLIETIPAAFEMEEILFALKEHSVGLNAGRWDYIFSIIKKFQNQSALVFPDRGEITMTVPFMQAYTKLLVSTCHKRGAHAMGGMAAFIPSRRDKEVNEKALFKVREDKKRESNDGFDGTWVAHPDLVPIAKEIFDQFLGQKPHQIDQPKHANITAQELQNFTIPGGKITEKGLRQNVNISLLYLDSWFRGIGAAAIYNLMEDAATAEISRAQIWQWIHHPDGKLETGEKITTGLFRRIMQEEIKQIKNSPLIPQPNQLDQAAKLLDRLVTDPHFIDFLTLPAYEELNK